ncbi:MAG: hypothetical protein B6U65_03270 [Candidatus Wolframiiraptor sp. EX4484-121]|nr:MAG: hypothetical protein B6U65_03270 [Candidatus Wolframiiraptor sp. EX4484-121]
MFTPKDIKVKLLSYGPRAEFKIDGRDFQVEPDLLIALEGIGTFKGVTLEERLQEFLKAGKDLEKIAFKMHQESTRRGHASLTTSLSLQLEVNTCSRVASMLLVSPPFASYLQESQRRRRLRPSDFMIPGEIASNQVLEREFERAVNSSYETYSWMIERGIELEDARYVLPLASKTSIFISSSLESLIGFILRSREDSSEYYPAELALIGRLIEEKVSSIAPALLKARMDFKTPLPTYPYANPYKPEDPLMDSVVADAGFPNKPIPLALNVHPRAVEHAKNLLSDPSMAASLNPFIQTLFLEPLSLAAYHQSIRHRTVPTAVESIYSAARRALKDLRRSSIIPPKIRSSESIMRRFYDTMHVVLGSYQKFLDENVRPSDAVYLLPQALKIYVVRMYNAFNLLWPQGYVATRTCSRAQWEEREVAYEIWRRIGERYPDLGELMGEKCKILGYCPEREWCPIILKYRSYGDEEHKRANRLNRKG